MKNSKSTILFQKRAVQYAVIAAHIVAKEGEKKFQERIRKNGFHPDLKRCFEKMFPEADMKLHKFS